MGYRVMASRSCACQTVQGLLRMQSLARKTSAEEGCRLLADRFFDFVISKDGAYVRNEIVTRLLARLKRLERLLKQLPQALEESAMIDGAGEVDHFL